MRCNVSTLFFFLLSAFVSGCGGSATTTSSPIAYPNFAGNWNIFVVPSNPQVGSISFGGSITNSSGSASGMLHAQGSACYPISQDVPVSGSLTPLGNVTLTSTAVAGQTLTITALSNSVYVPATNPQVMFGNFTISGGCADGESGTVNGLVAPSLNGVYAGTFQTVTGSTFGASISLLQGGPNVDGQYSVSGSVVFTGSPCFSTGAIASSTIFGDYSDVTINTNDGGTMEFRGITFSPITTPMSILVEYYRITGGACDGQTGGGQITAS
jgi:hypothetical protein